MDSIVGNKIPLSISNVFRLLGMALFTEGHLLAARAHLQYAQNLKGEPDEEIQQVMFETFRAPGGSNLLKHDFRLAQPPEDRPWSKSYANVVRSMDRGQFRKALRILEKIDEQHPNDPVILRGIAILQMFLV